MRVRYTCFYCHSTNTIYSPWKWFFTPHIGAKKWLKCRCCGIKHFMKRQDGRKWLDWPVEK